jgi:hypothetical protein
MADDEVEDAPEGRDVKNDDPTRCLICGSFFDACGFCEGGHEKGMTYTLPHGAKIWKDNPHQPLMKLCQVFDGCKCSICGGYFTDGENICPQGHEVGKQYIY